MLGKAWVLKAPGVKILAGSMCGEHYLGVSAGGIVPGDGLTMWVAKLLEKSRGCLEAWVIYLEMAENQGFPSQQRQGWEGGKATGINSCGQSPIVRQAEGGKGLRQNLG
jgi:hypothetical protein